ncbi:MAG: hypothetical protein Q4Q58_05590 [Thermoplasmata archaeon]|nr:hypothetical protein [Thermoplasmata archaeon]
MRIRYGWALIALITSLIMVVSVSGESTIEYLPVDVYILSTVCFVVAILFVIMAMFASNYGPSYSLFSKKSMMRVDELLSVEKELLKKTLYKNQLSSLYCGQSLLVTFIGAIVLLISSTVNIANDAVLASFCIGAAFVCGAFLKKRMYRIYQIDKDKLPGVADRSTLGHWFHSIACWWREWRAKPRFRYDSLKPDIADCLKELDYGINTVVVAYILQIIVVVIACISGLTSFWLTALMLSAAIAGFERMQARLVVSSAIDPSEAVKDTACNNPLHTIAWWYQAFLVDIVVANSILWICANNPGPPLLSCIATVLMIILCLSSPLLIFGFRVSMRNHLDDFLMLRVKSDRTKQKFDLSRGASVTYSWTRDDVVNVEIVSSTDLDKAS